MTAPVSLTPISCRIVVQGEIVADGSDPAADPSALSGLEVTWGRATTVDQPDTGTASFTLEDKTGDQAFARLVAVGRTCDIWATGTTWSGETAETIPDPTLSLPDGAPPPWILRATPSAASIVGGALRLDLAKIVDRPLYSMVRILPAAPGGADPAAWDHIPTAQPGQRWTAALDVVAGAPGSTIRVGVEWWADAGKTRGGTMWLGPPAPSNVPRHFQWQVTPPDAAAGQWLSLIVEIVGGYSWDSVPAGITWDTVDPAWTWDSLAGVTVDNVSLIAPVNPLIRDVLVFSGRITDATSAWDIAAGAALVDVTAADFTAELANRDVGAAPWPAETLSARANRIVAVSGAAVSLRIDPKPGALTVSRLDVDRQQVFPMLGALASGVDAVLWAATHATTGQYLWIEDMTTRPSVLTLGMVGGQVEIVPGGAGLASGVTLSACDVDLEPVRWTQTNADIATRAVVTYQDQTTTPDTTERTVQVAYTAAEDPKGPYGVRRVSVASQLTTAADATALAGAVLTRLFGTDGWRVGGLLLHVETDADTAQVNTALTLLDGTTRIGAAVLLVDLPAWSPVDSDKTAGYVEGGRYTYENGAWALSLVLSSAAGVGHSITWDELDPSWTWDQFDPAITWDDLTGVGPPT